MSRAAALFLDRDGVINVDHGYVRRVSDFEFIDGVFGTCRTAAALGLRLVVATNQAGIARGYYTEDDFWTLTRWMKLQFLAQGVELDGVYLCPYHEDGIGRYRRASGCRKPQPGMLLQAARDLDLDLRRSLLLGDKESDIEAGRAAGLRATLLFGGTAGSSDVATKADAVMTSHRDVCDWLRRNRVQCVLNGDTGL